MYSVPIVMNAQEVVCTPFDNNGDNIVGIGDLIDLLARFGDSDLDQDGIWDSADDCVGAYDACGVCNGPGPQVLAIDTIIITYDSIYVDAIDEWLTYELSRDTLLHLVCENPGCTDPSADNFDPYAEEGGPCFYLSCIGPTFDGYTYDVVEIGAQCWFKENLRTTVFSNGDNVPIIEGNSDWYSAWSDQPAACFYDNDSSYLDAHGLLYNWPAVSQPESICPTGWRVPSESDYDILLTTLDNQGSSLLDPSGFNGSLSGMRVWPSGLFYELGTGGYYLTSTYTNYPAHLSFGLSGFGSFGSWFDGMGHSVRCLRDSP